MAMNVGYLTIGNSPTIWRYVKVPQPPATDTYGSSAPPADPQQQRQP